MSSNAIAGLWWISLTFINAGLAQSRHRDAWRWWLVSLFIGPVATALIVVWPPLPAPPR